MIDSFAAGHDGYLKRYRDTGVAKVIGTPGRSVPGKMKNGATFPASLTVEEFYVDGERTWLANIRDTSNVEGVIFIDGFGTIQNADQGLQTLLGYRREDIVGKNIKVMMPPPYCDCNLVLLKLIDHDMYLERYRKTKVSNILRSVDGRIIPFILADGSVMQTKAIITRSDANDGSGKLLFKGTIKRGDLGGAGGAGSRRGFKESYEITLSKAGIIMNVSRNVLNMLGHSKDRAFSEFVGNPIEILIPALPDNPAQDKSNWMVRGLRNQSLNFYLLAVCKNFSVIPITYNLSPSKDGESIRMLVRDMAELDALITIDEMGTIMSVNDDAFILLGFDPDEMIGRNVNKILSLEVAEKQDAYLSR
jgi:PAS domain S-box-containing protein